jgi:WD40 repeat protein
VLEVSTAKKLLQVGAFDERLAGGFRSAPVFSTDGRAIAFAGPNLSQVHVWNVVTGKAVQTVRVGLGNKVVGLPSGGKTVLTWASGEGRVRQWDAATGQELRAVEVGTGVSAVTLSPGGETLAVAKGSLVEFRSLRE